VTPILSLEAVSVTAGNIPLVASASCSVEPGRSLAILGPNGAGKTTLLRVMATLLRPSHGGGQVLGVRFDSPGLEAVRPRIGLAGHHPSLVASLTLRENLDFVARVSGREPGRAIEVLEAVGLGEAADRLVSACSHGMRKRADLARLLLTEPELVLLDEPQAGLDSSASPLVSHLVESVRRRGGAAVLVSHDPTSILGLADAHLTLERGVLGS
jgi:ABC-type multidrug transport system ATPase subunit